ncbi:MAG: hypothetical protein ABIK27_07775 [Bacteroidota bacterium]
MSEKIGKDVGLIKAFESYSQTFVNKGKIREKVAELASSMRKLFVFD